MASDCKRLNIYKLNCSDIQLDMPGKCFSPQRREDAKSQMTGFESFAPLRLSGDITLSEWNQNYELKLIKKTRFDLRLDDFRLQIGLFDRRFTIEQRYS